MNDSSPGQKPQDSQSWLGDVPMPSAEELAEVETYLEYRLPETKSPTAAARRLPSSGPVAMVETAFLASAASLIWLVNAYFPPGPLLRILFPLPIALVYLRWGTRAAWMGMFVSGLLLAVLMGPPRSLLFLMPYGVMGVQLGWMWRRGASWYTSIGIGTLLGSLGFFVRIWLLSLMLGEDLWVYLINQATQFINWALEKLIDWGLLGWGSLSYGDTLLVEAVALVIVLTSSIVYLFTVHLAAYLLLERLGEKMPPPPLWVQRLIEG
ncbi:MAG: DUF2232 domain-containing protein [Cyanobacteria bacterium J06638_28]